MKAGVVVAVWYHLSSSPSSAIGLLWIWCPCHWCIFCCLCVVSFHKNTILLYVPTRNCSHGWRKIGGHCPPPPALPPLRINDGDQKRAILLTVIGPMACKLFRSLVAHEKLDDKSYSNLLEAMTKHHNPKPSEIVQRYKFNSWFKQQGEPI